MTNHSKLIVALFVCTALLSCNNTVNPDQLYTKCVLLLETKFISDADEPEVQQGVRSKMRLACERARNDCANKPNSTTCKQHAKRYKY